jgi:hypothetical protein
MVLVYTFGGSVLGSLSLEQSEKVALGCSFGSAQDEWPVRPGRVVNRRQPSYPCPRGSARRGHRSPTAATWACPERCSAWDGGRRRRPQGRPGRPAHAEPGVERGKDLPGGGDNLLVPPAVGAADIYELDEPHGVPGPAEMLGEVEDTAQIVAVVGPR